MPKTRRLSDANLVRRSQQGDRRAFGALVGKYDWRLRGLAFALLLDRGEMDAALASAYLRAWRDVVRVSPKDDIAAWLYRMAYNSCVDRLRLGRAGGAGEARPGGGAGVSRRGRSSGIVAGLRGLSETDRVALVLIDREGFSIPAAARIMGMPPGSVEASLTAARAHLADHLPATPPTAASEPGSSPDPDPDADADADGPAGIEEVAQQPIPSQEPTVAESRPADRAGRRER